MKSLRWAIAATAIAASILAPAGWAGARPRCPPGSEAHKYCEPGQGRHHPSFSYDGGAPLAGSTP